METPLIAFVFLGCFVQAVHLRGCNFLVSNQVVLSSENFEIIYPSIENSPDDRNVTLPVGATIIISCKGGHFSEPYKSTKTILATCNQASQLEAQDKIVDFDTLNCVNFEPQIAKVSAVSCGPDAVLMEIGFEIGLNITFVPQVDVCFDTANLIALYVSYNLTKSIGFIKSYLSTRYITDPVNSLVDFEILYENTTYQQTVINSLLGLPQTSTKYVNPISCNPNPGVSTPGFCFSRRPLAYRGAFVFIPQQYATYRYINVVPQWYFLDYNLDKLEYNVIDYVKRNKVDLEIFSGTFGLATLPHEDTKEEIQLFFYSNENKKAVPVPLIFWKLIYDAKTQKATIFLTINNPHQTEDDLCQNVICEDISDQISWLTWEKHNITKGYSYACNYQEAKAVITYLPDIYVTDILT